MEPIISPWFFYFASTVDNVLKVSAFAVIFMFIAYGLVSLFAAVSCAVDEEVTDFTKGSIRWFRYSLFVFIPAVMLVTFVPSKDTMYQMIAASYITPNNISVAVKTGKDIKEVLKQDIVDIIKSASGKEEK